MKTKEISITSTLKCLNSSTIINRLCFNNWDKHAINWMLIKTLLKDDEKSISNLLKREPEWLEFI
jgi:hypothetical protein